MGNMDNKRNAQYFIHSLQRYVFAPLSVASRLVDKERKEVYEEQEAFRMFRERLDNIEPAPSTPPDRTIQIASRVSIPDRVDRVRTAYRETVLAMPHYDDVYDETLIEHYANEFGTVVADAIHPESSVPFNGAYKNTLKAKTTRAIRRRKDFLDSLDGESQSLESSRGDLSDVFAELDATTIIPKWHCESFKQQLDAVAQRRQQTIQDRDPIPRSDDHHLCAYLYSNEPWVYPVLTAVARMREAVSLDYPKSPRTTNSAHG